MIRPPHPHEIALLPQIENAADLRYRKVGLQCVIDMPAHSIASLTEGWRNRRLWVAASPLGRPVGFALMALAGDSAWIDQLTVLDRWQGHGFGSALIDRAGAAARALGHDRLYLSTYRDVPWNGPFYLRRGFEHVPRSAWPHAFRRQFALENAAGHPSWRRTIMGRGLRS